MDSYAIAVRSRDALYSGDTSSSFSVQMPLIPEAQYKVTGRFIAASLTSSVAYALQIRSPALVRSLSTAATAPSATGDDGWVTLCVFAGTQRSPPGVVFFSKAPSVVQFRIVIQSTLALATSIAHNVTQLLFENIGPC